MRFWPARARSATAPSGEPPRDLTLQIDEGYLVAVSAVRLAVKNGVILRTLRDEAPWNEAEATQLAREAISSLIAELDDTAARLSHERDMAALTPSAARVARTARERARIRRSREEFARLEARRRTLLGVVERLRTAHDDETLARELAMRARDETLSELMQARLIPRAQPVTQTEEERREAIAGVKADLQRLIDERTGY